MNITQQQLHDDTKLKQSKEAIIRNMAEEGTNTTKIVHATEKREGCSFCGCIGQILSWGACLFTIGLAVGLALYFTGVIEKDDLPGDLGKYIPDQDIFVGEDPHQGNASEWQNSGSGLEMTLIDALDTQWHPYFDRAVRDWDNGTPDALTLSTELGEPDSSCSTVSGVIKVCNGNYGETDWIGINEILLQRGFIVASTAKMNDYFFGEGADDAKRQYTMCHEIGHGFGLPHTDEQFWNRDRGLDYTNNFDGNDTPDASNYERLAELYGTVGASGTRRSRYLKRSTNRRHLFASVKSEARRQELLSKWDEIVAQAEHGSVGTESDGWRFLHQSAYGEAHEIDLGNNYSVQIHFLRSSN